MTRLETLLHLASGNAPTYHAGATVSPGVYVDVDTGRTVLLEKPGPLPASLDGRVAVYVAEPGRTWGSIRRSQPVRRTPALSR